MVSQPNTLNWHALAKGLLDPRSQREIDDEITAELEFHLDEAQAEFQAQGLAPDEARRLAQAKFGDFSSIHRACRREQSRQVTMIRRMHLLFTMLLLASVAVLGWTNLQARQQFDRERELRMQETEDLLRASERVRELEEAVWAQPPTSDPSALGPQPLRTSVAAPQTHGLSVRTPAQWLERFQGGGPNWRHGLVTATELAQLPASEVVEIAHAIWSELPLAHREQFFKPFVFHGGLPSALFVLGLGASDPEPSVRERANTYLVSYAFQDFAASPLAGERWFLRWANQPPAEAVAASARDFAFRLLQASGPELERELKTFADIRPENARGLGVELGEVFQQAELASRVRAWLNDPQFQARPMAVRCLAWMVPFDASLQADLIRAANDESSDVAAEALRGMGQPGATWALAPLLASLEQSGVDPARKRLANSAASALAEVGDSQVVPRLIELMAKDPAGKLDYAIGHYALRQLTGVSYDESRNAAWWRAWLSDNGARLNLDAK